MRSLGRDLSGHFDNFELLEIRTINIVVSNVAWVKESSQC